MEIIKHGCTYKEYTCNNCNCVFSVTAKDLDQNNNVFCPECNDCIDDREECFA